MGTLFEMRLHYGGKMIFRPQAQYVGGKEEMSREDSDMFSLVELNAMMKNLGYCEPFKYWYKSPAPGSYTNLNEMTSDLDAFKMAQLGTEHGQIEIYVESVKENEEDCGDLEHGEYSDNESHDFDLDEFVSDASNEEFTELLRNKTIHRRRREGIHIQKQQGEVEEAHEQKIQERDEDEHGLKQHEEVEHESMGDESSDQDNSFTDYEYSSDERNSSRNGALIRKENEKRRGCSSGTVEDMFRLKQKFESPQHFKEVVQDYAVKNGKSIRWRRSSQDRMEARCEGNCRWRIHASWTHNKDFIVKAYVGEHECARPSRNKQAGSKWIARQYVQKLRENHALSVTDIMRDLDQKYALTVNKNTCYKAKAIALQMINKSLGDHYRLLPSYIAELKRVNRDSQFDLAVERHGNQSGAIFKRFYMGFETLIKGFRQGCRPVIGLNGCFLKTQLGGQLLSAVGRDGNNQMFPIAWAVVEGENQQSWNWFLKRLAEDLSTETGFGFTLISDQQKGLQNAVSAIMPEVEHRNCARHIYANWKKKHNGYAMKNIFWRAVKSCTDVDFQEALTEMKAHSIEAFDDFMAVGVQKFCRSKINTWPTCEAVDNNLSECFNAYILKARSKPIIDMLEDIRRSIMKRLSDKKDMILKCSDSISPSVRKKLEANKISSGFCIATHAGNHIFEVGHLANRFIVDLAVRTCSCRQWELSGIPCSHAIACIHWLQEDSANYVSDYLKKSTWLAAYDGIIPPLNGQRMWKEVEGVDVSPPAIRKQAERPKKARNKDKSEMHVTSNPTVASKKGILMKCMQCNSVGHNKRTCKFKGKTQVESSQAQVSKPGRPRKHPRDNQCQLEVQSHNQSQSTGKRPKLPIKRNPREAAQTNNIHREKRLLTRGYGVTINTETGVQYVHMPGEPIRTSYIGSLGGQFTSSRSINKRQESVQQQTGTTSDNNQPLLFRSSRSLLEHQIKSQQSNNFPS